jgi:hypothetical protein
MPMSHAHKNQPAKISTHQSFGLFSHEGNIFSLMHVPKPYPLTQKFWQAFGGGFGEAFAKEFGTKTFTYIGILRGKDLVQVPLLWR